MKKLVMLLPLLALAPLLSPSSASLLLFDDSELVLRQGEQASLSFQVLGSDKGIRVEGLPEGVEARIELSDGLGSVTFMASQGARPGDYLIRVVNGDDAFFLRLKVAPFYGLGLLQLALSALIAGSMALLYIKRPHLRRLLPSAKLIAILLLSTLALPAFGDSVELAIEEDGDRVEGALVLLFDSSYSYVSSSKSGPNGIARFDGLKAGRYIYEVYYEDEELGYEFWGSGAFELDGELELEFERSTPLIANISLNIDGEELLVKALAFNPGLYEAKVRLSLVLDRDMAKPYDILKNSKAIKLMPKEEAILELKAKPSEPGQYYLRLSLIELRASRLVTDNSPWYKALEMNGDIAVSAKGAKRGSKTFFALFDGEYGLIGIKEAKGSSLVRWSDMEPKGYIIEAYHESRSPLGFIEFWGAKAVMPSNKPVKFNQSSPSIEELELGSRYLRVRVYNGEPYAKLVKVSIILDKDSEAPFDNFLESEAKEAKPYSSLDFLFKLDGKSKAYTIVQSLYAGRYLITDQDGWL